MQSRSPDARLRNVQQRRSRECVKRFDKRLLLSETSKPKQQLLPTYFGAQAATDVESTKMRHRCCCSQPPTYHLVLLHSEGIEISRDKNTGEIESSEPGNSSSFQPLQATNSRFQLEPSPAELLPWMLRLRNVLQKTPQGVREGV